MADFNLTDYLAMREVTGDGNGMDHEKGGRWSVATSLWVIVGILIVLGLFWWCYRGGADKADLASTIQRLGGRLDCIEPNVKQNADRMYGVAQTVAATVQGVADIKECYGNSINRLDDAVFEPVIGCGSGRRGCGCGDKDQRFVEHKSYALASTNVDVYNTCVN
ncbi:MAG: hypothetical protein RRY36_08115 [Bacteroidaceae bacterium]